MSNPYTAEPSPFAGPPRKLQAPDSRLCPVCKGMHFLAYDVPVEHPLFAKIVRCPHCQGGHAEEVYADAA